MRTTKRDERLLRDTALSHVHSRDNFIALGYFDTPTRANTRLRQLRNAGFIKILDTPFHGQFLYAAGPRAASIVGERIARLLSGRRESPRFIQHALCTTQVRLALKSQGALSWRFEQQLSTSFEYLGHSYEVRPDGLAVFDSYLVAVEADLGHVSPAKFAAKLFALDRFIVAGESRRTWGSDRIKLLTVTTGSLRARHLRRLAPAGCHFDYLCQTHDDLGIPWIGAWS